MLFAGKVQRKTQDAGVRNNASLSSPRPSRLTAQSFLTLSHAEESFSFHLQESGQ